MSPYAAARNGEIVLPPPHELSRPVSPVSVPQPPLIFQPATRAQPAWSSSGVLSPSQNIYPTTRQESTTATTSSTRKPISMSSQAVSLPSQASTSISQFDLIKAPPWAKRQFPTWSRPPGEDVRWVLLITNFGDTNPRDSTTDATSTGLASWRARHLACSSSSARA